MGKKQSPEVEKSGKEGKTRVWTLLTQGGVFWKDKKSIIPLGEKM